MQTAPVPVGIGAADFAGPQRQPGDAGEPVCVDQAALR